MHLTRFGFNTLVLFYLAPLVLIDIAGNTFSTGATSDFYYYKSMFDGLLVAYCCWQLFGAKQTAHIDTARNRTFDKNDEVVGFENIGAIEHIYCGTLCLYAALNWYFMHSLNAAATGVVSIGTLVWSFLSIAIAILSAIQFYHLKSGAIVELKKKVLQ